MRLSSLLLVTLVVSANLLLWIGVNKPYSTVETRYPVESISVNPYRADQSPFEGHTFTPEALDAELARLADKTKVVRLYSATHGLEQVPALAATYRLGVIVTAYLGDNPEENRREVDNAIQMAGRHRNVQRVIIGNETQLHHTVPREELLGYLQEARTRLRTPVSTAEPWDFWLNHPEMADAVDYLAIHILPYWVGVPVEEAVQYIVDHYHVVRQAFPKKKVFVAEVGWPSDGPQRGAAVASRVHQAEFVRHFVERAAAEKIPYNLFEAFDQPWKSRLEGEVGEHWGIMDAERREKFPLQGPVLEDPNWKYWMAMSTVLGFLSAALFLLRAPALRLGGRYFSVIIFQVLAAIVTQLAREATDRYMSPGDIVFWGVMLSMQALLAIILITDTVEIAAVVGDAALRNRYLPHDGPVTDAPRVSIHVACYNEPPALMCETLASLARLDYPNFEVIVVDNNTRDESVWRPVERCCAELGARFRFFHLPHCPGFKAGALNVALQQTDPTARIVGVIDADYVVESGWLRATVPYFQDATVGLVQAPQEHRSFDAHVFQRMENDEYAGFFRIGMVQRNEDNAILQHGTMTLIDRAQLDALHGWAEWCICEDAELGLRILAAGRRAVYVNHPFGHGLVPDSYEAYAKQRFRWAYGAMRIMRHHWARLLGLRRGLSRAQRYHFIKGWLPWIGDALHLLFTLTAIAWSAVLIADPLHTDFPEPIFVYPALLLVVVRIVGTLWTYAARVRIGRRRTLLALIAGGSLTHKIAKAVWQGLLGFRRPFYRTPKLAARVPLLRSLLHVREELGLTLLLGIAAYGIVRVFGVVNDQAVIWVAAVTVQSFPYLAALIAAMIGSRVSGNSNGHVAAPAVP